MDLSTGGDLDAIRAEIRAECPVVLGTVPIYQAMAEADERRGDMLTMTADELLDVIRRNGADHVDFMTLHCGVTRDTVAALDTQPRIGGIVSRGGSLLAAWMRANDAENPLYEQYDDVLALLKEYGVAISLGDGLRPGAIADATDAGQVAETRVLGELVLRAREAGVQAFVEGPGHVPLDQIEANVVLQKRLCAGAPFYVLGPLVTDVAPGYDHITGAIGGAICAAAGADFLCYVTPAEHLGLPTVDDVIDGVMASRIAAHAADVVKGIPGAVEWDDRMSRARCDLDWDTMERLALDPGRVRITRGDRPTADDAACSMCGKFCSVRAGRQMREAGE
jgi:phosphomethylpyrimidine synthase